MKNSGKRELLIQAEHIKLDSEIKDIESVSATFKRSLKKKRQLH